MRHAARLLPLIVLAGCGPSPAPPAAKASPNAPAAAPAVVVVMEFPEDSAAVCEPVAAASSAAARTYRRATSADILFTLQPLTRDEPAQRFAFGGQPDAAGSYQVRFTPGDDGTVTMAETLGAEFDSLTLSAIEGAWEDLENGGRLVLLGGVPEDGGETLRQSLAFTAGNAARATMPDVISEAGDSFTTVGGDVRQRVVLTADRAEIGYAGDLWGSVVLWEK
ncbi:hypothetical protein [Alienimonas sp. DA493]|uniref:hypothetical protein n=1 Tax=Alienimonas sp. DA493 TaxID=3373605 RepID=UPI003754FB16